MVGQTLEEARKLYNEGRYAEAKATMTKYYKSQPGNANYGLWYGVCCLRTGEPEKAVKPLEQAVKRRVTGGRLYLGQAYEALYRYADAVATYEDYRADLERLKKPTEVADSLLVRSRLGLKLLKGVEQVCVVDSIVVGKAEFLRAYRLSPEVGQLHDRASYLSDGQELEGTVYETEMGNRIYYASTGADGRVSLHASDRTPDGWGESHELPGLEEAVAGVGANYPYVMADGITLYYSAEGAGSVGGRDIFVTRYHAGRGSYLTPENAGMPFNSPANDYLLVIDEYAGLGWWASDRCQPADSVCIYLFIPQRSKQVYNYESTDPALLRQLASLHSIGQTWSDASVVADARARRDALEGAVAEERGGGGGEFEFVVSDERVYTTLSDFRSSRALEAFREYLQLEAAHSQKAEALSRQREAYADATDEERRQWAPAMADSERQLRQLRQQMDAKAQEVRQLELQE